MTKGQALNEVTIHSAADISKVTLNMNDNYDSSSDEENFTSRLDLSFESDDNDSFESLPNDQMNGLSIDWNMFIRKYNFDLQSYHYYILLKLATSTYGIKYYTRLKFLISQLGIHSFVEIGHIIDWCTSLVICVLIIISEERFGLFILHWFECKIDTNTNHNMQNSSKNEHQIRLRS